MRLEHEVVAELKQKILGIVGTYLDLKKYKVFFFGSRVSGKGNERSDIDLGIWGPEPIPLTVLRKIKDDITEIKMLYAIDVVDFAETSEDFREVALKNMELFES